MNTDRPSLHPRHQFSLLYLGVEELSDDVENRVFEAGCDDALLGIQNGFLFLDFSREAPSFQVALLSAIAALDSTGLPIRLARVEMI